MVHDLQSFIFKRLNEWLFDMSPHDSFQDTTDSKTLLACDAYIVIRVC